MYSQLKEMVDNMGLQQNKEYISKRARFLIDKYRDRTFFVECNGKVYVIKFNDSLDVFNIDQVNIEFFPNGKIRYVEPKMVSSRKHYGTVGKVLEIMEQVELSKDDRANFERYMLSYA